MKILSVNAGSSSLKFTLFDMPEEKELISGVFERIGIENSFYTIKLNGEKIKKETELKDHKAAFELLVKELIDNKIVDSLDEIAGIGHRIVQGGSYFDKTVLATEDNISIVEKLSSLAPLHNPAAVVGIRAAQSVFPNATQTLVFDTAFHQTMEEEVYLYPVPYEWYTKYAVRRYGAHGTSHKYVSMRANEILDNEDARLITCHIGNGASISAVKAGKCVETSMGLTPNAGLMMGTRCGDIDATILPYIMEETGMSAKEMDTALNKQSGLLGISGVSSDSRDIEDGINNGDERCILAQKMYVKRIVDFIAKYYVELGGCDAIIFTAGVGENSISTRMEVMEKLACLGVKPDEERNNVRGKEALISADNSKIPVYVIPTNEELMIATDTYNLAK
ncbi:MAG: acetate kinase [Clostridiaceae bacterium]|jgi:acetate kinase|nr:MAG: acetate kinase [Clostridiaceae bacterium]